MAEPSPLEKCALSLAMTSVRPVNRLLGFGIRGMTPSDIALLLLWMWICQRSSSSTRWYRSADIKLFHSPFQLRGMCRRSRRCHERQRKCVLYSFWVVEDERKRLGWERKKSAPSLRQYTDFHPPKHVPGLVSSYSCIFTQRYVSTDFQKVIRSTCVEKRRFAKLGPW